MVRADLFVDWLKTAVVGVQPIGDGFQLRFSDSFVTSGSMACLTRGDPKREAR